MPTEPADKDTQAGRAQQFRALHQGPELFLLPNPWDAGSARLFESLGYAALATTSGGFAATLGRLDGQVTLDEALAHGAEIAAATNLPVSADLENAFADEPSGVAETIRLAAAAGLAGCSVEDYTRRDDQPIYDPGLARDRIAAAAEATRGTPGPLVLTARAENYLHGRPDLADTIARLQAYQEAGADALYAPGLTSLDDIRTLVSEVDRPVNVLALAARAWQNWPRRASAGSRSAPRSRRPRTARRYRRPGSSASRAATRSSRWPPRAAPPSATRSPADAPQRNRAARRSAGQLVPGLIHRRTERGPVRHRVGADPHGSGVQVDRNAGHAGQLADLALHGIHAVRAGHARDGDDGLIHGSVLSSSRLRYRPAGRSQGQAYLTPVRAMLPPRPGPGTWLTHHYQHAGSGRVSSLRGAPGSGTAKYRAAGYPTAVSRIPPAGIRDTYRGFIAEAGETNL